MDYFEYSSAVVAGVLGLLLVLAGLTLGLRFFRRAFRARPSRPLDERHIGKLIQGLFHWTDDFASDVSEHRQMVDSLKRQVNAAEQQSPEADPAAVVRLLSRIVQANDMLQQRLDSAELTLKEQAVEITSYMSEARTDTLTSLPNRRVFDDELTRRISEFCRHGTSVCVVLMDIDLFKRFNDRFGHLAGDAVLVHVASVLRESVREIDLVARLGGEEFVLLLPNSTRQDAWQAAERVRTAIEQSICTYDGQGLQVTMSCGAAQLTQGEDAKGVVNRADQALYASKSAGRNCAHWHDGKESLSITTRPAVPPRTARESVQPATRERRKEEFSQVCDELRRKLLDVVSQHA